MDSYRIVFAGTPDFAAEALDALIASEHEVVAVYTQPDRPAGRGQKLQLSPVKELALKHNIAVEQPENFKSEDSLQVLASFKADIMVVAAYGIILPKAVLECPNIGCLNIHASLLPRWRGAAPIQRSIAAGDKETGIDIMLMDEGLDTGDILLERRCPIEDQDTGSVLHDRLAALGAQAIVECLEELDLYLEQRCPQENGKATYAHKLNKEEATIDWNKTTLEIDQHIRAFNSWPIATTKIDDKVIRVWHAKYESQDHVYDNGEIVSAEEQSISVACSDGLIHLKHIQLPGKKAMNVGDVLNGKKDMFAVGKCFG